MEASVSRASLFITLPKCYSGALKKAPEVNITKNVKINKTKDIKVKCVSQHMRSHQIDKSSCLIRVRPNCPMLYLLSDCIMPSAWGISIGSNQTNQGATRKTTYLSIKAYSATAYCNMSIALLNVIWYNWWDLFFTSTDIMLFVSPVLKLAQMALPKIYKRYHTSFRTGHW